MAQFSQLSKDRLATCHPQLIRLMNIVVLTFDITVVCGWRNEADQMKALAEKKTYLGWPHSKHNKTLPDGTPCSHAVDIAPSPIDWEDEEKFVLLGGYVLGIAEIVGIPIRWGGCWDMDWNLKGNKFRDYPHFELLVDNRI